MGDFIKKDMEDLVAKMQPDRTENLDVRVNMPDLTEAIEAVQDDMINDLVQAIIDTVEQNVTVEYDENEDGKFTYASVDTPNIRDMLKDDIAEYILEKR